MIKQLIVIGILFLLNSCKQNESKKTVIKEVVEAKKEITKSDSFTESYVVNDSLVFVLKSKLEKIALNKKFAIDKKLIKNKHVVDVIDTILTRTYKNTKLTSYKTTSKELICKAKIENSEFALNEFIKLGTKKNVVEKFIRKIIQTNTLKIGNLEHTSVFILRFESGNLKMIEFEGYVD